MGKGSALRCRRSGVRRSSGKRIGSRMQEAWGSNPTGPGCKQIPSLRRAKRAAVKDLRPPERRAQHSIQEVSVRSSESSSSS